MSRSFRKTVRENPVSSVVLAAGACVVVYDYLSKKFSTKAPPQIQASELVDEYTKTASSSSQRPAEAKPAPGPENAANLRIFTVAELSAYTGADSSKPILLGVDGLVFDVTPGKDFYGPGGAYNTFAGKDATRALALVKVSDEMCNVENPKDGLSEDDLKTLQDWISKFKTKYKVVGRFATAKI